MLTRAITTSAAPRRAVSLLLAASLALATAGFSATAPALAAENPTFRIYGAGWGHGIGLSQWGAKGWAERGKSWRWISEYYFPGARLAKADSRTVRVNMDAGKAARQAWTVAPEKGTRLTLAGKRGARGQRYVLLADGGRVIAKTPWGRPFTSSSGSMRVTGGSGKVRVVSASGMYHSRNQTYRGSMVASAAGSRVKLVNALRMDDYVMGVLPGEVSPKWDDDALKAQAVAARSYAYASPGELWPTTMSQVYLGYSHETPSVRSAVRGTSGMVLKYKGKVVQAFFHSSSGGHTVAIEDVWPGTSFPSDRYPYFKGVPDPYNAEAGSKNESWGPIRVTGSTLGRKLNARGIGPAGWTVVRMRLTRTSAGHVKWVNLTWRSSARTYRGRVLGDTFRSALALKSTNFGLSPRPDPVDAYERLLAKTRGDSAEKVASAATTATVVPSLPASSTADASATVWDLDASQLLDPAYRGEMAARLAGLTSEPAPSVPPTLAPSAWPSMPAGVAGW